MYTQDRDKNRPTPIMTINLPSLVPDVQLISKDRFKIGEQTTSPYPYYYHNVMDNQESLLIS